MSRLMGLYAQHLGIELEKPSEDALRDSIQKAACEIDRADAVVVGVGSGASTACGLDHYNRIPAFDGRFAPFEQAHGFSSLMDGFYHLYASNEERWAFLAEYISFLGECPVGSTYANLKKLLRGKEYFILTTNIDGQVRRAFPEERVWLFQGDFGYLQCSQPCCDELVHARDIAANMRLHTSTDVSSGVARIAVDPDALPRCKKCSWLMTPWVRDATFLEGSAWRAGKQRYEDFVSNALAHAKQVVFLELGVGGMTPSIIEIPFWNMVRNNENAFYLRVNLGKMGNPKQLEGKSLTVTGDIDKVLAELARS